MLKNTNPLNILYVSFGPPHFSAICYEFIFKQCHTIFSLHYKTPPSLAITKTKQFTSNKTALSNIETEVDTLKMASLTSLLLFVSAVFISFLITVCRAQDRAPHGLANTSPLAFSPEAYEFFHPNTQGQSSKGGCSAPDCSSTLPLGASAAAVKSTPGVAQPAEEGGKKRRRGGHSLVSIPVGLVFALLVGLGAYFVFAARQRNAARAKLSELQTPEV